MPCIHFKGPDGMTGIMTVGGPDIIISAGGRDYTFEFHSYCGPFVLSKKGDPLVRQPGAKSPFWTAIQAWVMQGKRVVDGRAIWNTPKPTKVVHLGGTHYEVAEYGDAWSGVVEVISRSEAKKLRLVLPPLSPPPATPGIGGAEGGTL